MKLLDKGKPELHPSLENSRTEEVAYIVENMPTKFGWMVSSIVLVLISFTIFFGWIVQYPDVLTGQITINTRQAPVKLVSNSAGSIVIFVKNGLKVKKGEYIAYVKNGASPLDVQRIKNLLDIIDIHHVDFKRHRNLFPQKISMGEVNQDYFNFLNLLYQYLDYIDEQSFQKQLGILHNQVESQKKLLSSESENYKAESEKFKIQKGFYGRDSILFSKRVISSQEFEKSRQSLVVSRQQYNYLEKNITTDKYDIKDSESKIEQLKIDNKEKLNGLEISMLHAYYQLKESIEVWERKYVFVAPLGGKLAYLSFWKNEDFLDAGTGVFTIIPSEINILGQVLLPEKGAGKVLIGQEVIIKLDNSPYTQFGSIRGKVISMSAVTNEQTIGNNMKQSTYLLTVSLPNNLKTNYGTTLSFHSQAKGTAEIITNKRRLIERLFDNLKHSVK